MASARVAEQQQQQQSSRGELVKVFRHRSRGVREQHNIIRKLNKSFSGSAARALAYAARSTARMARTRTTHTRNFCAPLSPYYMQTCTHASTHTIYTRILYSRETCGELSHNHHRRRGGGAEHARARQTRARTIQIKTDRFGMCPGKIISATRAMVI